MEEKLKYNKIIPDFACFLQESGIKCDFYVFKLSYGKTALKYYK